MCGGRARPRCGGVIGLIWISAGLGAALGRAAVAARGARGRWRRALTAAALGVVAAWIVQGLIAEAVLRPGGEERVAAARALLHATAFAVAAGAAALLCRPPRDPGG